MANINKIKTPSGDTYYVQDTVSGYQTLQDVQTTITTKQDVLVSGTNIKTVQGHDITGSGNVIIASYDSVNERLVF